VTTATKHKLTVLFTICMFCSLPVLASEYQGDQQASPFFIFLHNLFFGKSNTPTVGAPSGSQNSKTFISSGFSRGNSINEEPSDNNEDQFGNWPQSVLPSAAIAMSGSRFGSSGKSSPTSLMGTYSANSSGYAIGSGSISGGGGGSSSSAGSGGVISPMQLSVMSAFSTATPSSQPQRAPASTSGSGDYDGNGWLPDPNEPMPVGDGTVPMLIFALGYAVWIYRKKDRI
jgi:hypothetical protein